MGRITSSGPTSDPRRAARTVEHTADGRFIVVDGRRWRATDPQIPDVRQAELRAALMTWWREKRAARAAGDDDRLRQAQQGVQAVKVALGERGTPWWEQDDAERRRRWSEQVELPGPR